MGQSSQLEKGFRMKCVGLLCCVLVVCSITSVISDSVELVQHTNIVLIGATGDLAKKYLWRAVFDLFEKHYLIGKVHFAIYGCARMVAKDGRKKQSDILLNLIKCGSTDSKCRETKMKFVESVQYHRLKVEEDYKNLSKIINENTQSIYALTGSPNSPEYGRLIYMSIPPSQYAKTAQHIHTYLRPKIGRPWFRIVMEKPFGHDYHSARSLADKLSKQFTEQEIYRIDHYLGKTIVKTILPFRYMNKEEYGPMWNRKHIERVEVVMKEKVGVKGRTKFYNEVGVVRDVMQNHLTELVTLIAMDLPENSGNIRDLINSKNKLLKQIQPLREQSIITAQYAAYSSEYLQENNDTVTTSSVSTMPTFAAVVLTVPTPRWHGVPFVVVSGKQLDEKTSYVRVVFRQNRFCALKNDINCHSPQPAQQLLFMISNTDGHIPSMVAVSKTLPDPSEGHRWLKMDFRNDAMLFGESINDTVQLVPQDDNSAYGNLIESVYQGERHHFVEVDNLLLSWKIWSPAMKAADSRKPRIYKNGKSDHELLDFYVSKGRAEFVNKVTEFHAGDEFKTTDAGDASGTENLRQKLFTFRKSKLVAEETDTVIAKLAEKMLAVAENTVEEGGCFHLALSGGSSKLVLRYIVDNMLPFPWRQTHVWMVDERCVPLDDTNSNFNMISTELLQHVEVPYLNVHPMPVHLSETPCSVDDNGDLIYSAAIKHHLGESPEFDFVLLGVGEDGHTASLFPNQTALQETLSLVTHGSTGRDVKVKGSFHKRMTLTYKTLNSAKNVAVLVLGGHKHDILHDIAEVDQDVTRYPITGIKPESEELIWYIDNPALFGVL